MSNLSGTSPRWVSKDKAGGNPSYPSQVNQEANLEKDIDTELSILDVWKKSEAGKLYPQNVEGGGSLAFRDEDVAAWGRVGRPFLVSIAGSKAEESFSKVFDGQSGISGADLYTSWVKVDDSYKVTIPYSEHRKGLIKGEIDLNEQSSETFVIPKVKVYSFMGYDPSYTVGNTEFEEVYDSASVNIRTGDITVYSDIINPICLVVIY